MTISINKGGRRKIYEVLKQSSVVRLNFMDFGVTLDSSEVFKPLREKENSQLDPQTMERNPYGSR